MDPEKNAAEDEKQTTNVLEDVTNGPLRLSLDQNDIRENVGLQEYVEARKDGVTLTPELNRRVRMKIDCYVLPMMFITSVLQFLDKTALNYANLFGIRTDLHLTGSQYSWLASLFYLGYLVTQIPSTYFFTRFSTGKILGVCTIFWGITVLAFTWSKNFAGAAACRFLLGVFEAPITPGLTLAIGYWWTREEAPLRYNFLYSALGWAGIIGSLMSTGISKNSDLAVEKWQLVFIVLGSLTTAWGFILLFYLPDSPVDAKFLSHDERILATARVASNQVGIKSGRVRLYQVKSAILDFKTWCIVISIFAAGVPNGVISNFSTEIIKNLGFSTIKTTLMDCVGNAFQVVGLMIGGYIASTFKNTRILVASAGNIACLVAAATLAYLPAEKTWMRLVAFWFTNLQSVSFSLALNMISANMSGYTKKQVASALTFISYCVGNIAGPQFVIQSQAPQFPTATKAMMIGFVGKVVFHAALGIYMLFVNISRDHNLLERGDQVDREAERRYAEERGMLDQTEFENKAMRYVL